LISGQLMMANPQWEFWTLMIWVCSIFIRIRMYCRNIVCCKSSYSKITYISICRLNYVII